MSYYDFALGALTVVGVLGFYKIWKLFQAPSVESIERMCGKAMPIVNTPESSSASVVLWGMDAPGACRSEKYGVSDSSPYVSRVEAYLRLARIPHEKRASMGGMENPRGKAPFAKIQSTMVDDSQRIMDTIKNAFHVTMDDGLTDQQVNTGFMVRRLLQGSLYWVLLHQMFNTQTGRDAFEREVSHTFAPVIRTLICKMVFRKMNANLYGSGFGRMPNAEIVKQGQEDVRALSFILGKSDYLLGTKQPTSYDVDVYAWLVLLFSDEAQVSNGTWVTDIQKECPNLVSYVQRMKDILYPKLRSK